MDRLVHTWVELYANYPLIVKIHVPLTWGFRLMRISCEATLLASSAHRFRRRKQRIAGSNPSFQTWSQFCDAGTTGNR